MSVLCTYVVKQKDIAVMIDGRTRRRSASLTRELLHDVLGPHRRSTGIARAYGHPACPDFAQWSDSWRLQQIDCSTRPAFGVLVVRHVIRYLPRVSGFGCRESFEMISN